MIEALYQNFYEARQAREKAEQEGEARKKAEAEALRRIGDMQSLQVRIGSERAQKV